MKKTIVVEGKEFKNIEEASRKYNLSSKNVRWRLQHNWSIEEAFGLKEREEYEFNNKKYKSVRSLYLDNEDYLKSIDDTITYKKIINRRLRGWSLEEAIGIKPHYRHYNGIEVENVIYPSLTQAVKKYNLNYNNVQNRLKRGWSIEKAFEIEKPDRNILKINVILQGVKYRSIAAACRFYNIKYSKVLWRLKYGGWSLEEAFELKEKH